MSIHRHVTALLVGAIVSGAALSSAASRPWKPTAVQMAADYAAIIHDKGNAEFVNLRWWASPTARPGTALAGMLEKYVVISVVHWHVNRQNGASLFDDIDALDVRDDNGQRLAPVAREALPPTAIGILSTVEAGLRQSIGQAGERTKFFTFEAGAVRACEKGGIAVRLAGETYTWETPFPGCPQQRTPSGHGADVADDPGRVEDKK